MSVITDPGDSTDGASMTNDGTAAAVMDNVSLSVSDGTSTVPVTVIGGDNANETSSNTTDQSPSDNSGQSINIANVLFVENHVVTIITVCVMVSAAACVLLSLIIAKRRRKGKI